MNYFAAIYYPALIAESIYISDNEMEEMLHDTGLLKSLQQGLNDAKDGNYKFVA